MLNGLASKKRMLTLVVALVSINAAFATSFRDYKGVPLTYPEKVEFFISGGPFYSRLSNDSSVAINSFVVNRYDANKQTHWQGLWGVGLAHSFGSVFNAPVNLSLGGAVYTVNLGHVQGTEYPFANDSIDDTLNYKFAAKSSALLAEARLFYTGNAWQPFALLGAGLAWNQLTDYQETPTDSPLSAAPVSPAYGNHTSNEFSYELGLGVQHQLYEDVSHKVRYIASVDYRYMYFGKGQLATFPAETTGNALQYSNLSTQGIMFALKVSLS